MIKRTLGEIPAGCRRRLLAHYGHGVETWLDAAPACWRRPRNAGSSPSGTTSTPATPPWSPRRPISTGVRCFSKPGWTQDGTAARWRPFAYGPPAPRPRCWRPETICRWPPSNSSEGDRGCGWAAGETQVVAAAIQGLHMLARRSTRLDGFPWLARYLHGEVVPRIQWRAHAFDAGVWRSRGRRTPGTRRP
ncbi:hypothetical protein NKH18_27480 [Streptomyces sp. M10(2022)]